MIALSGALFTLEFEMAFKLQDIKLYFDNDNDLWCYITYCIISA